MVLFQMKLRHDVHTQIQNHCFVLQGSGFLASRDLSKLLATSPVIFLSQGHLGSHFGAHKQAEPLSQRD